MCLGLRGRIQTAENSAHIERNYEVTYDLEYIEKASEIVENGFNYTNSARISINLQGSVPESMSAEISSPNFPSPYPLNARTEWLITVPDNHRVMLYVTVLDLKECCHHLSFWDGRYIQGSWLGSVTGQLEDVSQRVFYSTENSMYVHLYSDLTLTFARGFKATAFAIYSDNSTVVPTTTPSPDNNVCSQPAYLYAYPYETYYLESPNYPNEYFNNLNCLWVIQTTTPGHVIHTKAVYVSLESYYDYVTLHDGNSTDSPLLGNLTYVNQTFHSTSNALSINFVTDQSVTYRGFQVQYTAVPINQTQEPITTTTPFYNQTLPNGNFTAIPTFPAPSNSTNPIPIVNTTTAPIYCSDLEILYIYPSQTSYLNSPNYPNNYVNYLNCSWLIRSRYIDYVVQLTSVDVQLESCCDYVTLYDGNSTFSRTLGTLNNGVNEQFYSTSNDLLMAFSTDYSITDKGFRVQYRAVPKNATQEPVTNTTPIHHQTLPNGNSTVIPTQRPSNSTNPIPSLNATTGVIPESACTYTIILYVYPHQQPLDYLDSPYFPNNYSNNLNCTAVIKSSSANYVIELYPLYVFLGLGDYANIYDGNSKTSPLLGNLTNGVNRTLRSTSDEVYVNFVSDYSVTDRGFRLQYAAVCKNSSGLGEDCLGDEILYAYPYQRRYLESPNYPNDYPNNFFHSWSFQSTNADYVIRIMSIDVMLEACCDHATLYDGNSIFSQTLGTLSNGAYELFYSSTDTLRITFSTDSSITERGFRIEYMAVPKNATPEPISTTAKPNNQTLPTNTSTNIPPTIWWTTASENLCNSSGVLYASPYRVGYLESPNFPNNYYNNMHCEWLMRTYDPNYVVQVTTFEVFVEACCDFAILYDGDSTLSPSLGYLRNNQTQTFVSSSDMLLMTFRTDSTITNTGFRVQYWAVLKNSTQPPVTTTAPFYNNTFPTNSNATFFPTVPLPPSNTTNSTYPPPGDVCPGLNILHANPYQTFILESPNYPNNYYNNLNCSWLVQTFTGGHVIQLNIVDVSLEGCCDYAIVYEGGSPQGQMLGQLQTGVNGTIYSNSNSLLINFVTDYSVTSKGFKVEYTAVPKNSTQIPSTTASPSYNQTTPQPSRNCSHVYQVYDGTGYVWSPNYPENYYNNANCTWYLQGHLSDHVIKLALQDLWIGYGDVLTVYDGESFEILYQFTRDSISPPAPILSKSKSMFLWFATDNEGTSKGFRFQFWGFYFPQQPINNVTTIAPITTATSNNANCSKSAQETASLTHQDLFSPGFPSGYPNNLDCGWAIYSPYNSSRVELSVVDVSLDDCCDYVRVFDGDSVNSPMIAEFSGACNVKNIVLYSTRNMLFVNFKTDRENSAKGFHLRYRSTEFFFSNSISKMN